MKAEAEELKAKIIAQGYAEVEAERKRVQEELRLKWLHWQWLVLRKLWVVSLIVGKPLGHHSVILIKFSIIEFF